MKIRWSIVALQQLDELQDYIAEDDPLAAYEVVTKIFDRVENDLPAHPQIGRVGEHYPDTRELVISDTPFIVVYQFHGELIEILRVRHGSQLWPPIE